MPKFECAVLENEKKKTGGGKCEEKKDHYSENIAGREGATFCADVFSDGSVIKKEKTAKINLVLEAIQKKENITMTDEEMDKAIMDYAQNQGCSTKEELYEKFEEAEVKRYVQQVKVLNFITDSATIKEAGK